MGDIDDSFEEPEPDDKQETIDGAIEEHMHPSEFAELYGSEWLDDYRDQLSEALDLSYENESADWTQRETYANWDELQDYLETFNGGYPEDDIIDIVLTDEGYELYVAIDSP